MSAPTPRTDAAQFIQHDMNAAVDADFARTLERELAKANAILASIEEDGTEEHNAAVRLRQELAAERDKVWVLREALDEAQSCGGLTGAIFMQARAAIAATEDKP